MSRFFKIVCLYFVCFLYTETMVNAQDNAVLLYDDNFTLNASRVLPAKLGSGFSTFQISIFYFDAWLANNSLTKNNFLRKGTTTEIINQVINDLKPTNRMYFGQDIMPLAIAFKIRKNKGAVKQEDAVNFALGVTEQLSLGFTFSENFMQLAWNGNKQFAGEEVDLGPLSFNFLYNREYFLGIALPIVTTDNFMFRFGGRFKFLQGINAIYMPKHQASFYTDPEGRYIEIKPDFEIHTAGITTNLDFRELFASKGTGVGFDFGTRFIFKQRAVINLSILDIGRIKFNNSTQTITNNTPVKYEGLILEGLFGGEVRFDSDSVAESLNSQVVKGESFKMPLSSRLILQFEYRTPMITRKGKTYDSNVFYLTYIQGFKDHTKSTIRPYFGMAYSHNFNSTFNLGTNLGFGGANRLTLGAFFSIRAGSLRIGVGSGNLSGLFARKRGTGVHGTLNLTFASRN